jgi:hypothetical protein
MFSGCPIATLCWCGQLDLGWQNGRRTRKYMYGASAAEVQQQLLRARSDLSRGLPVAPERQKVAQYLEGWLQDSARVSTRPRTFERYGELIRLPVVPTLGHFLLDKLAPSDVQRLLNAR